MRVASLLIVIVPAFFSAASLAAVSHDTAPSIRSNGRPLQLAASRHSTSLRARKMEESEDQGLDVDKSWPLPKVSGLRHGKSGSGGYNPNRVRLFWRRYHGGKAEPKPKPRAREGG